ncbi:MAG: DUF898 family protein [Bifidobacteriaceae bacterium]|jgi:uncharacterized membrane protein YjgN (DUF898 family)|nr:DUF898 family protein [Bifidobacteriaceae bacterium]
MTQLPPAQNRPYAQPRAPFPLQFGFDGGAATWIGVQILGVVVTVVTLGLGFPWAVVMVYRWKAKHTIVNGYRLRFTGTAMGLFGKWILWLVLLIITCGIYILWLYPHLTKWIVEHQELDPTWPGW